MTTTTPVVPPGHYVRACMLVDELPVPYVPSERRLCDCCGRAVWSDPKSAIPQLGQELILCYSNDVDTCAARWMASLPRP